MEQANETMSDVQKVYNFSKKAEQLSKMTTRERFIDNLCDVFINNHMTEIKARVGKDTEPLKDVFLRVTIDGTEENIRLQDIYDNLNKREYEGDDI